MAFRIFATILVLDQAVKFLIMTTMTPGQSIPIIENVFHITFVLNPGAAFGLLANQQWIFMVCGVALLGVFLYYYQRLQQTGPFLRYGCVALLAGAMGNLLDRIENGLVVDFFDFRIWPVFNIADIAIVGGVISMMYAILRQPDVVSDKKRGTRHEQHQQQGGE